eukprot:Nitzschia sp. Nitz4//scaffold66_size103028//83245//88000//NITZ4_004511-RA/size103028-snap-gene-0.146-mRNA-1//-1//CDS//3329556389//8056//frame0
MSEEMEVPSDDHDESIAALPTTTPSKSRVNLGAPANFYFKYVNSSKKAPQTPGGTTDDDTGLFSVRGLDTSAMADASVIDLDTTASSSDMDLLNKSTLSDTTDLTASSFVLQATSRQVLRQVSKQSQSNTPKPVQQDKNPSQESRSDQQRNENVLENLEANNRGLNSQLETVMSQVQHIKATHQARDRELTSRRFSTASNTSVQSLYAELKSLTGSPGVVGASTPSNDTVASTGSASTTDDILASMKDIFSPSENSTASHTETPVPPSDKSTLSTRAQNSVDDGAASPLRSTTKPEPGNVDAASSPPRILLSASKKRLTPGLTPTKLDGTPRRILNPRAIDSPARRTRSSSKKLSQGQNDENSNRDAASPEVVSKLFLDDDEENNPNESLQDTSVLSNGVDEVSKGDSMPSEVSTGKAVLEKNSNNYDEKPISSSIENTSELSLSKFVSGDQESESPAPAVTDGASVAFSSAPTDGDTASIADIADILGMNSSSPGVDPEARDTTSEDQTLSENNSDGPMTAGANGGENAHTNETSGDEMDLSLGRSESLGSAVGTPLSAASSGDTASLADIAGILGGRESMSPQKGEPEPEPALASSPEAEARVAMETQTSQDSSSVPTMWSPSNSPGKSPAYTSGLSTKSPMRLTPNSHMKPTPTKIAPSPRRVLNPKHSSSPAMNTRNARRSLPGQENAIVKGTKRVMSETKQMLTSQGMPYEEQENVVANKRRRSVAAFVFDSSRSPNVKSPSVRKVLPVGILSSTKRRKPSSILKSSQKSVAFGSPEAAFYHIGSPSVSMTPMPASRAKALFLMPITNSSRDMSDSSVGEAEPTVDIETDINVLVDKITCDDMKESPSLSPIERNRDTTGPVILPGRYELKGSSTLSTHSGQGSDTSSFLSKPNPDEYTVELEGRMEGLLESLVPTKDDMQVDSPSRMMTTAKLDTATQLGSQEHSPMDTSVDLTDAQSIASLNSAKSEKYGQDSQLRTEALAAQRLSFDSGTSEIVLDDDSETSTDDNEGVTVELEDGMTGLLAAASVANVLNEQQTSEMETISPRRALLEFDDTETSASPRIPRRDSVSSRKFTLSPAPSVDISVQHSSKMEKAETKQEAIAADSVRSPDMTLGDLFAQTRDSGASRNIISSTADPLVRFNEHIDIGFYPATSKWQLFLEAVCGEVENRTDTSEMASEVLADAFQREPNRFSVFQKNLSATAKRKVLDDLKRLTIEGEKAIESEWNNWLANVLNSFGNPLIEASEEIKDKITAINGLSASCSTVYQRMIYLNEKRVRLVRRKSMSRRKGVSETLQHEVESLEARVNEARAKLDSAQKADESMRNRLDALGSRTTLNEKCQKLKKQAQRSRREYLSLHGTCTWEVDSISKSKVTLKNQGTCEETCSSLVYDIANSVVASNGQSQDMFHTKGYNKSACKGELADFVKLQMSSLKSNKEIQSMEDAAKYIQGYNWKLGRLDQTIREIGTLLKRYDSRLLQTGSQTFAFSVQFEGGRSKVTAEFSLENTYPSVPLEVKLSIWEGKVDLDSIHKTLIKTSKPGPGSLSRACDIIQAYVR